MGTETNLLKAFPELVNRGYSEDEINAIYELGRVFLEAGNLKAAESIMSGLSQVVVGYAPAWLGLCYIHSNNKNHDAALSAARQALRIEPDSTEVQLFLIACLLTAGDYNSAGTYLGEVSDKVDGGAVDNPYSVRFFKAQLARYQAR